MVCNMLMDSKQKNVMCVNLMSHTVGTTLLLLSSHVSRRRNHTAATASNAVLYGTGEHRCVRETPSGRDS